MISLTQTGIWDSKENTIEIWNLFLLQHLTIRIIFFVVLFLVFMGIYFAWIQFRRDMLIARAASAAPDDKQHSLELSTTGIKVSSPVLGVIILALSLAFFYLYLAYVYPVKEIF